MNPTVIGSDISLKNNVNILFIFSFHSTYVIMIRLPSYMFRSRLKIIMYLVLSCFTSSFFTLVNGKFTETR